MGEDTKGREPEEGRCVKGDGENEVRGMLKEEKRENEEVLGEGMKRSKRNKR